METVGYKRTLSGSVGSGVKSVFGGNGRRYYILEHRVGSQYHKAGESQKIIVDQIELGRDPKCQVRFDESFTTVSRRHAAIVKDGDNWKLVQLSKTNTTYLNGRPVANEWYLQNGDEIQLSTNGPKLGFIVPQGDKSLVKSIGLSARLDLFRQQALRPYKRALAIICSIFAVALIVGGYFIFQTSQNNVKLNKELKQTNEELEQYKEEAKKASKEYDKMISDLKNRINVAEGKIPSRIPGIGIDEIDNYVYLIYTKGCKITMDDGSTTWYNVTTGEDSPVPFWIGTGFLLNDGRFVTSRRTIENWCFWNQYDDDDDDYTGLKALNLLKNNGGSVVYTFEAVSPKGDRFTFRSNEFKTFRDTDEKVTEEGIKMSLAHLDANNIAYIKTSKKNGLPFDTKTSNTLKKGINVTFFGYPTTNAASIYSISPESGESKVAIDGLKSGFIYTNNGDEMTFRNSGSPVFCKNDKDKYVVVGVVSDITNAVIPISRIYK